MSLPPPQASERGFTLVEVLLATALVTVIAAMVFGSLHLSTLAIESARSTAAREQMLRSTLRIMAEELTASVSNPIGPWVGINSTQEGQPADTVAFLTLGQFRGVESSQESELVRIVYTREGDRLLRFIRRNLYGLTDEGLDQLELAKRVKEFNVRYYDSRANAWADEWDGRARNAPPTAVLIELTLTQDNDEPRTYRQWVAVGVRS
jgi:general secretion pathway protein J